MNHLLVLIIIYLNHLQGVAAAVELCFNNSFNPDVTLTTSDKLNPFVLSSATPI